MIAECVVRFKDLEARKMREIGERFEVSVERFASLNSTKYGQVVREHVEDAPQEAAEPIKPRKSSRPAPRPRKKGIDAYTEV